MADRSEEIRATVKAYLLETFLPGEDPDALTDDTALISSRVLDSISTLKLVSYLEEEFNIQFEANEIHADHLDTLNYIATFVMSKAPGGQ